MLDRFPHEIVEQILGHLPTASSIINVAITNRKLHSIVSADDYAIFRDFVRRRFPSIRTPPLWREMACALTSRSRAWDRRSFIAHESHPPEELDLSQNPATYQKFGYIPVIDSYDQWVLDGTSDQKQVLAIGTGGRLRMRITEKDRSEWKSMRLPDDHLQQNDILDVRLLRPNQHQNLHGETIMLRKANREIVKVESGVGKDNIVQTATYNVQGDDIDCMDINMSNDPLMAVCNAKSLHLFPVQESSSAIRPNVTFSFSRDSEAKQRKRCLRFLDTETIAVGIQLLEGRERAPILTYNITPAGVVVSPLQPLSTIGLDSTLAGRHSANVITNLDNTASLANRPGQVFLSGWTDGLVRLHDLRTPSQSVAKYADSVDDGRILSLAVIGHERFYAGSHQNACLKVFDLRMQGARAYSYLSTSLQPNTIVDKKQASKPAHLPSQRGINIFLALTVQRQHLLAPLPRQQTRSNLPRYRGSIYALSSPSPSSAALFAGIENHVIEFEFTSTDDRLRKRQGSCDLSAGLSRLSTTPAGDNILSLSCYERPREGHVSTDTVVLRKQVDWQQVVKGIDDSQYGNAEDGWDHRWRSTKSWKTQSRARRWRNGHTT